MVVLLLLALAYPFFEAYHLTIDHRTVEVPGLHQNLRGLRIVFVTDIHMSSRYPAWMVQDLVKTINSQSADVVVLGGDYTDTSSDTLAFFQSLPRIQARLGVFGVLGMHDRTAPEGNLALIVKAMTAAGVTPLVNSVSRIKVGQTYLYLSGVDDYQSGQPDTKSVAAQLRQDDFVIFVSHSPDVLPEAIRALGADGDNHWFDLALFGGTHGGQITLLGLPLLPSRIPDLGERYLRGWLEENRASIVISNGVGTEDFPVRLFAPAQLHVVTLKNKTGG
ncbi:MAG: metallophosphoesterase [Candidatus Limiplasma sp.]|nr:metallophosphoesterase [Candidatus Limiplasma sp.]MEA5144566.1 metallophosphoesterase [Candidatus Limiplasma sp.]